MSRQTATRLALALAVLAAGGCAVGPDYHRPKTGVPAAYRFDPNPVPDSFGDKGWWEIYQDPLLLELIETALANNFDVRIAAARVEEARAQLGVARLQQLPQVSLGAGAQRSRTSAFELTPGEPAILNVFEVQGSLSYEIDFWGKYRRASEAARAQLLASRYSHDDVAAGLVASVATAYFTLQTLDEQLVITRRTVESRQKFVELTHAQHERGTVSGLDVATAQAQLAIAEANIPDLQRQIGQAEDQLSVLLGRSPDAVLRNPKGALRRIADAPPPPIPRPVCPRACCSAAPTCARRRRTSWLPTPRSAWRAPTSTRVSRSPRAAG